MYAKMKTLGRRGVVLATAMLVPAIAAAAVTEVWQNRLIQAVEELGEVENAHTPARMALDAEREASARDAEDLRVSLEGAQKRARELCERGAGADCLEAKVVAQESSLEFTENVHDRLQIEARGVDKNFEYSIQMADVLADVLADLEREIAKEGTGGEGSSGASVALVENKAHRFLDKAMPALKSAAMHAGLVARSSRDMARIRGAKDVAVSIERFRKGYATAASARTPVDRLGTLKAQFETFAAINRQARRALEANARALSGISAVNAASVAESMIASYAGGLKEFGREWTGHIDASLQALDRDINTLYEGVGGPPEGEKQSFFEDEDDSFFN